MTFPVLPANGPSGYNLTRSLRFRSSASAYLNRTPASASNRTTWTWSGWVKLSVNGNINSIFTTRYVATGPSATGIRFLSGNTLDVFQYTSGSLDWEVTYTPVYRDPSAWYHFVIAVDTTQATSTNRVKFYVNGVQVTATTTGSYPTQNSNTYVNSTNNHAIGTLMYGDGSITPIQGLDGYTAEVNFVDGQALTPSSFGSTNSTTGVWQPAKYTGTYGTNGFYLPFTNTTSTTTLGYDSSGNSNNWTTNNISLTAGVTYDSMTDVPTLTNPTTANYAVLNPLKLFSTASGTFADGNLTFSGPSTSVWYQAQSSITMSSGQWYFEATIVTSTSANSMVGIAPTSSTNANMGFESNSYAYLGSNGTKQNNNTQTAYGATYTAGDVIGVAFDATNGTLTFYKNNTSQGTAFTGITGEYAFAVACNPNTVAANFGQRPFTYTPPSGFVALNTYNLPASTVPNGASYMAATLYTGTSASQAISNVVGSASFQPDFVWAKQRSAGTDHVLYDSIRTGTYSLTSNNTAADVNQTSNGCTISFGSSGFTAGADTAGYLNYSARTYVAWNWKAGGTAVSNTSGSITSSVSANTTSGFSVVTYTGNGTAGATVGHGLGVAPSMFIVKGRSGGSASIDYWYVYHTSLGNTYRLYLNATNASSTSANVCYPSGSSQIYLATSDSFFNASGENYVAYCFAAIKGFSAFGSFVGNGSATGDGPFIYTGFRPRFLLFKGSNSATSWVIVDSSRNTYNVETNALFPDLGNAEDTTVSWCDFLSNGFKIRRPTYYPNFNGDTTIYAAFAENPFQNSLAR